jgi:hypothetical protein
VSGGGARDTSMFTLGLTHEGVTTMRKGRDLFAQHLQFRIRDDTDFGEVETHVCNAYIRDSTYYCSSGPVLQLPDA